MCVGNDSSMSNKKKKLYPTRQESMKECEIKGHRQDQMFWLALEKGPVS